MLAKIRLSTGAFCMIAGGMLHALAVIVLYIRSSPNVLVFKKDFTLRSPRNHGEKRDLPLDKDSLEVDGF